MAIENEQKNRRNRVEKKTFKWKMLKRRTGRLWPERCNSSKEGGAEGDLSGMG
jgi:hypothetical protein